LAVMTARQGKGVNPGRDQRLAAALRDNLKRRKAQAKGRAQANRERGRVCDGTGGKNAGDQSKDW
jgi:hypothetical protein